MVPEGWEKTTLEGLIDIHHGFAFKSEYFTDSGQYVLMTPGSFYEEGGFRDQGPKTKYYSGDIPSGYLLKKGDILIAMTEQAEGLLGSTARVPESGKYLHNQRLGLIKIKEPRKVNLDFLYWLYNFEAIRSQISEQASGTKVKHTSPGRLVGITALLPTINEQEKIAKILSTWDQAIAAAEQLLENSLQQKKALMQQLLGSHESAEEDGEQDFKRISEIAERIQRKSDGGDHPVLTISSLSGFVRQDEKYNRFMAGKSVDSYIFLKHGEFAYNKGNSKTYEFGCIFDLSSFETGLVPHVYVCFKLKPGLSHRYFKYLFEADYLKPQLSQLVNTGVRNNGLLNIKPSEFMNTKVPVPSLEEQERIADILHIASKQIMALEQKLACLKQEKKALMQQLLTGKRRVTVDAKEAM